jgi:hypothetical protein
MVASNIVNIPKNLNWQLRSSFEVDHPAIFSHARDHVVTVVTTCSFFHFSIISFFPLVLYVLWLEPKSLLPVARSRCSLGAMMVMQTAI